MNKKLFKQRLDSNKEYIDSLQQNCSKINNIRVDLSYKKPYSGEITLEEANKDLTRLLNNRRSKPTIFENNIGYIIKKEYTEDKGMHFHCMFIFDGNKIMKDAFKCDQIGKYWNQITQDKGSFYNCNRDKEKYNENGIGLLDYKDEEKRKILDEKVISYLCKNDQLQVIPKNDKKDREVIRGTLPKSKGNKGRPRGAK
jgi:hypothetical protein